MTNPHSEPVDAYRTLDGTLVEIPPPPALEDGPMPEFGSQDQSWLNKLIAFRDRAIGYEHERPKPVNKQDLEEMDPETRELCRQAAANSDAIWAQINNQNNARLKEAGNKFGKNGLGYLNMLNDGSALQNFWVTLRQLLCQRIGLMEYQAPNEQQILRDLLARFPERVWLPIVAQQCWPITEHRVSEHVHELMASYLNGPRADFRHLETGAAKPERESDLPDMVKKAVLGAAFGQHSALATFKNMALDPENLPDTPEATLEHGQKTADLLRNFGASDLSDEQTKLVEELFREMKPARTYDEGLTQSEINLTRMSAYRSVMRRLCPGREEGYFLSLALSKIPQGFYRMNFATYPRRMVWPYIATHLDIIDRAMGLADSFVFEPKLERTKAIAILKLLPKVPMRYGDALFDVAIGSAVGGRADAQAMLAGASAYVQPATALLSDKKAVVREHATRTLAAIGNADALPALRARLETETAKRVIAALNDAIGRFDADDKEALSLKDILAEFKICDDKLTAKTVWVNDLLPPVLTLNNAKPAPKGFANWLLIMACRQGASGGSAHVDDRLGALDDASRAGFAAWVLSEWIRYDAQPYPKDKAAEVRESAIKESYWEYKLHWDMRDTMVEQGRPEYDRDTPMTRAEWAEFDREQITHRAKMFINWKPYLFSAIAAKGLLAIARHAPPDVLTREITGYLSGHGKRMAQCKALLDCLFAAGHADAIKCLRAVAKTQKQKGLRIHAANLLGAV